MSNCILCDKKAILNYQENASRTIYNCQECGVFSVSDLALEDVRKHTLEISAFLSHRRLSGNNEIVLISFDHTLKDKGYVQLTVEQIVEQFPCTLRDKLDRALQNLAFRSSMPGAEIRVDTMHAPMFCVASKNIGALIYMLDALQESEMVKLQYQSGATFPVAVTIMPAGWYRLDALEDAAANKMPRTALLCFDESAGAGLAAAKKACKACGYKPIEFKAGEKGIDNSLIAQAKASKLVICDLSDSSPTSYYLAGLARTGGRRLILTCMESRQKKLCVDTRQINALLWDNADTFSQWLADSIRAND